MSNAELLTLAANAAGLKVFSVTHRGMGGYSDDTLLGLIIADSVGTLWNPLENDSQALRLAVDLGLRLTLPKYKGFGTTADHQADGIAGCTAFRDDPMAQTREAIVRAAAEKGRAMQ
jgi:hypothetical protein